MSLWKSKYKSVGNLQNHHFTKSRYCSVKSCLIEKSHIVGNVFWLAKLVKKYIFFIVCTITYSVVCITNRINEKCISLTLSSLSLTYILRWFANAQLYKWLTEGNQLASNVMLMHGQLLEPINELISDTLVNGILACCTFCFS